MMTEAELAEIEARHARATPGPWRSIDEKRDNNVGESFVQTAGDDLYVSGGTIEDRDFIAASHQDIPQLIAEIRRLQAELSLRLA